MKYYNIDENIACTAHKLVTYADWEAAGSFEKAARKKTSKTRRRFPTMTNIYKLRAQLLTEKYEPFFEDFKQYKDDRILVPNCRDQLLEACAAMETVSNNFVRVAFNKAFNEQEALMESIVTRFTGKVWRDFKWMDAE